MASNNCFESKELQGNNPLILYHDSMKRPQLLSSKIGWSHCMQVGKLAMTVETQTYCMNKLN